MSDVTGAPFHDWCEICKVNPGPHVENTHETPMARVKGVYDRVQGEDSAVDVQVNYVDGDREPQIYVGADTDLTPEGLDELIAVLQQMRQIARSVKPVLAPVGGAR